MHHHHHRQPNQNSEHPSLIEILVGHFVPCVQCRYTHLFYGGDEKRKEKVELVNSFFISSWAACECVKTDETRMKTVKKGR